LLTIPVLIAVFFFGTAFVLLSADAQYSIEFGVYYVKLVGSSFTGLLFSAGMFLVISVFLQGAFLLVKYGFSGRSPKELFSFVRSFFRWQNLFSYAKERFVHGFLLVLALSSFFLAIGQLNVFNIERLRDEALFAADVFLTGTFPPFALGNIEYPGWFVQAVELGFFHLGIALVFLAVYLFLKHVALFREAVAAFFLVNMLLYAGWIAFPALSPHDRFLDNVYNLSIPPAVQEYVVSYAPQQEIQKVLDEMRAQKQESLTVLPTTTMPSAHIAWAVLLLFYSFRLSKWLVFFSLPFALLSMLGTVLFAQHYFVDVPAGIFVALMSILIVSYLKSKS